MLLYNSNLVSENSFEIFISPNKIAYDASYDAKNFIKEIIIKDLQIQANNLKRNIDLLSSEIAMLAMIDNPLKELFDNFNTSENEK